LINYGALDTSKISNDTDFLMMDGENLKETNLTDLKAQAT
jgi:hypothetical protein